MTTNFSHASGTVPQNKKESQTGGQKNLNISFTPKTVYFLFQFAVFFRHLVDEYNWKHVMFMYQYYTAQSGKVQFCVQSLHFVHIFALV